MCIVHTAEILSKLRIYNLRQYLGYSNTTSNKLYVKLEILVLQEDILFEHIFCLIHQLDAIASKMLGVHPDTSAIKAYG